MSTNVQLDAAPPRDVAAPVEGSVLTALLKVSGQAGLDPVAELYNEALSLAQDGHYGQARDRLQVLLGLAPADGEAHLLLAKVHVAGQQWRRALAELDEAHGCGATVPEALRTAVLRHLQADVEADEDRSSTRTVRDDAELRRLRSEVRKLRSEHAHLAAKEASLERDMVRWMWIATGTSLVAIAFILSRLVMGVLAPADVTEPETVEVAEVVPAEPVVEDVGEPSEAPTAVVADAAAPSADVPTDAVVRDPGMAAVVAQAIDDAGVTGALSAVVRGEIASLSGTVATHADLKAAIAAVEALPEITKVDTEAVVNRARREGGRYTVVSGDSLSRIAYRQWGNEGLHAKLLDANPVLGGKPDLQVGQTLVIPAVD